MKLKVNQYQSDFFAHNLKEEFCSHKIQVSQSRKLRFSEKRLTRFQKFFSIWVPMNAQQAWKAKLEEAHFGVHICKKQCELTVESRGLNQADLSEKLKKFENKKLFPWTIWNENYCQYVNLLSFFKWSHDIFFSACDKSRDPTAN